MFPSVPYLAARLLEEVAAAVAHVRARVCVCVWVDVGVCICVCVCVCVVVLCENVPRVASACDIVSLTPSQATDFQSFKQKWASHLRGEVSPKGRAGGNTCKCRRAAVVTQSVASSAASCVFARAAPKFCLRNSNRGTPGAS